MVRLGGFLDLEFEELLFVVVDLRIGLWFWGVLVDLGNLFSGGLLWFLG